MANETLTKPKHDAEVEPVKPGDHSLLPLHAVKPAASAEETLGFLPVLRRSDFRHLWFAQVASQLADKFLMFTLVIVVYSLTGKSTPQALLMIAYTIPGVLLSAPAGVFVDRHDKRRLMFATNIVRGLLILLIPVSLNLAPNQAWPLLLITLLFSSVGQLFAPAEAASIPHLVTKTQIMVATSLFMTTVVVTIVLGPPLATLAVLLAGNFAPFYAAAAFFGLAAIWVMRVRTSLKATSADQNQERQSLLVELHEGFVVLRQSQPLRVAMGVLTLALTVVFAVFVLGAPYITQVLHHSPRDSYIILVPATIGLVTVAVALGRITVVSRSRLFVGGMLVSGASLLVLSLAPTVLNWAAAGALLGYTAAALALIFGLALGSLLIPAFTVLQEQTTEETRGRIFGGIFSVINAAIALPLLLAGTLADIFHVSRVMGGLGVLMISGGVIALVFFQRQLRALDIS